MKLNLYIKHDTVTGRGVKIGSVVKVHSES